MHGTQQMTSQTKQIIDWAMEGKKALGLVRRFEPPHLAFLLARRRVRHFGSIVRSFVLAMANTGQEFPTRG
jgi:hypothetical protein